MSGGVADIEEAATFKPGVDVIVVNYQTPTDLREFLGSYRDTVPSDGFAHLYVANVCPHDDDRRVPERFLIQRVIYELMMFNFADNIGYNRAVNRVGSRGVHEFIAVFNADVVLRPGALDQLVAALRDHPDWGVVGPRQVDDQGLLTAPGIFGTPQAPQWRCWKESGADGRYSDVRDDCVTVLGSAFVMRRSVWEQLTRCELYRDIAPTALGPMLPCAHYYGETAAMYHAVAHAWKLGYLGTTTIVHKWHRASIVGGHGEQHWDVDQAFFRRFCAHHGIACD